MKSEKVKIGIFEPYLYGQNYGNQTYIRDIFKYIDKEKYQPILIGQDDSTFLYEIRQQGGITGVVHAPAQLRRFGGELSGKSVKELIKTISSILSYSRGLYLFFKHRKIDLVQCHSIRALLVTFLSARLAGKPRLYYVKGELSNPVLDRIGFLLADMILFQSETNMRSSYPKLISQHRNKVRIVPNGVDLEEIEAAAKNKNYVKLVEELGFDSARRNICYLGRISPQKGVHLLIEAVAELSKSFPDITVYLVGDCHDSSKSYIHTIERLIESSTLDVKFTGFRADALEILSLMDLFVLPSFSEGFPHTILEAMALGKPVISTNVGGIAEFLKGDDKLIVVPAGDSKALAEGIRNLLNSQKLRQALSERGRRYVYENHTMQHSIMGLMGVYETILSK